MHLQMGFPTRYHPDTFLHLLVNITTRSADKSMATAELCDERCVASWQQEAKASWPDVRARSMRGVAIRGGEHVDIGLHGDLGFRAEYIGFTLSSAQDLDMSHFGGFVFFLTTSKVSMTG